MRLLSSRFTKASSLSTLFTKTIENGFSAHSLKNPNIQNLSKQQGSTIPGHFLKWGSLVFVRTSRFATGFTPLEPKPLDSIMDVERAMTKSPENLVCIWDDVTKYFVIPLWRGSGYTTMFAQVNTPHMLFTSLEDYKARGTQASPYFTVSHYTEFAESKGLGLIRGDVVFTSKIRDEEAEWLLETTQSFYLNDARYKLVEQFNKHAHDFEFKDVLRALNMPVL